MEVKTDGSENSLLTSVTVGVAVAWRHETEEVTCHDLLIAIATRNCERLVVSINSNTEDRSRCRSPVRKELKNL